MFHAQLYDLLKRQIGDGELSPGQKIPSERSLSDLYGVSRITAKTAVLRLVNDGLVVRAAGKGTFVADGLNLGALAATRTGNIGFVRNKRKGERAPLLQDAVYLSLSQSIEREVVRNGMHIMIATVDEDDVGEMNSYKALVDKVDGLIIAEPRTSVLMEFAQRRRKPVVLATPSERRPQFDSVDIDNEQLGYDATRFAVSRGHTTIAYVQGRQDIAATQDRLAGHLKALGEAGLSDVAGSVFLANGWTMDHGEAAYRSVSDWNHYTAVICTNDSIALGVIRAASASGRRVPEDLSVIGCDNIELSERSVPPLTTIDIHIQAIGNVATSRLFARLDGDDGPVQRILLPFELIERESCADLR